MFSPKKAAYVLAYGLLAFLTDQGAAAQAAPPPGQPAASPALSIADASLVRMERSRIAVRDLLARARAQRDAIASPCISDKLSQITATIHIAGDLRNAAVTGGDAGATDHARDRMELHEARVTQLAEDANQCVGSTTVETTLAGSAIEGGTASSDDALQSGGSISVGGKFGKYFDFEIKFWWMTDPPKPATPTK